LPADPSDLRLSAILYSAEGPRVNGAVPPIVPKNKISRAIKTDGAISRTMCVMADAFQQPWHQ